MNNPLSTCLADVKQTLKSGQESGNNSNVSNGRIALTLITRISALIFQSAIRYLKREKPVLNIH